MNTMLKIVTRNGQRLNLDPSGRSEKVAFLDKFRGKCKFSI